MRQKNNVISLVGLVVSAVLFVIWGIMFNTFSPERLWRGFLVAYLFIVSLSGGLIVWPAIVTTAYGNWMKQSEKYCYTGLLFSPLSIIALIVLWIGSNSWAPWIGARNIFWLDNSFLFLRNLIAQSLFWFAAYLFLKNRFSDNFRNYGVLLLICFTISYSLLGFDLIMVLDPHWHSMMLGGYFMVTSLYLGLSVWAFLYIIFDKPRRGILHDLGKLIIAFCMLSFYTMFSQLFPIWFENLPYETSFLISRINLAWKPVSILLLIIVYMGPVIILLPALFKKNKIYMGIISVLLIIGLWIERWWLVFAEFSKNKIIFDWPEIITSLAFISIFASTAILSYQYIQRHHAIHSPRPKNAIYE